MAGLRNQALTISGKDLGVSQSTHEPFAVIMDIGYPQAVVTVVSFASGDASIYFSTGGGVLGGVGHESVRKAAVAFVHESSHLTAKMQSAANFPYAAPGAVRFYVRTNAGTLVAEAPEKELASGKHEFSPLYIAGQGVITQLRLITPAK
ncbi:MAG TPA: hypothetical protein VHX14_15390 [Thermoanaerobaculia bacterium]|nr:hypothetical protein [Thermoanaerobaculia bacterium]